MSKFKEVFNNPQPRRHSFRSSLLRQESDKFIYESNLRRTQSCMVSLGKSRGVLYRAKSKMKMIKVTLSPNDKTPSPEIINDYEIVTDNIKIKPCKSKRFEKSFKIFFDMTHNSKKCPNRAIIVKEKGEKGKVLRKVEINELLDIGDRKTLDCDHMRLTASHPEWKFPDLRIFQNNEFLCEKELQFLKKRKIFIQSALKKLLNETETLDDPDRIPHIALMGSGGGYRAMVAMSGIVNALYEEKIFDCILYTAVLSGSSWYIGSLYSHPDWPETDPREFQKELKLNILKRTNNLKKIQHAMRSLWKVIEQFPNFQNWNLTTDLFAPLLGEAIMSNRLKCKWSHIANKLSAATVPLPLLSAINAKEAGNAKEFHEWVEFSPYEVSIPKYGAAIQMKHFGSKFIHGEVAKEHEELKLFQIMAICGSAFAITNDELKQKVKTLKDEIDHHEGQDSPINSQQTGYDELDGSFAEITLEKTNCVNVIDSGKQKPKQTENGFSGLSSGSTKFKQSDYDVLDGGIFPQKHKKCLKSNDIRTADTKQSDHSIGDQGRGTALDFIQNINLKETLAPLSEKPKTNLDKRDCKHQSKQTEKHLNAEDIETQNQCPSVNGFENNKHKNSEKLLSKKKQGSNSTTKGYDEYTDVLESYGSVSHRSEVNKNNIEPKQKTTRFGKNSLKHVSEELSEEELSDILKTIFQVREKSGLSNETPDNNLLGEIIKGIKDEDEVFSETSCQKHEGVDELDGSCFDIAKAAVMYLFGDTRKGRAAYVNNFLRKISFDGRRSVSESCPLFENYLSGDPAELCIIDAGLAFNSPYPLLFQTGRDIDLILSFDFTDRKQDSNKPFKTLLAAETWARTHKMKFPNIEDTIKQYENEDYVRELYVFEDKKDMECPIIMHFVLVNNNFRYYKKSGETWDADFTDFTIYDDQSTYNCMNFHYTARSFDRLSELAEFIVFNNLESIKTCIKNSISRKIRRTRKKHLTG